jgi:hypothetical protein
MDCLNPPLEETPAGQWYCPICAPALLTTDDPHLATNADEAEADPLLPPDGAPYARASSVASSSRSLPPPPAPSTTYTARTRKGKRAIVTDDSDAERESASSPSKAPTRPQRNKRKSRVFLGSDDTEDAAAPLARHAPTLPRSSPPPPPGPRKVRLKLSARVKAKDGETEEGSPRGLFDDVLAEDDRDVSRTTIVNSDKQRFEQSRINAEVCRLHPIYPRIHARFISDPYIDIDVILDPGQNRARASTF